MDYITEEDDYATYNLVGGTGCMKRCDKFKDCKVVLIPYVIFRSAGSGWIFPQNSPLLPIFKYYLTATIKEGALSGRIVSQYSKYKGVKCQVCPEHDGTPVGAEKCFSLFGLMFSGAVLSFIVFL